MARRKKRTRGHIIADMSENHFEKLALKKGFSVERTAHDYGYDILLFSYDNEGEIENGYVSVQLKASDSVIFRRNNTIITFQVSKKDLDLWLKEFNPVILVVYDAANEKGYWLYIQAYFQSLQNFTLANVGKKINVYIPISQKISKGAMTKFSKHKARLYKQIQTIQHVN